MWIRSQDKNFLIEAKRLGVDSNNSAQKFINDFIHDEQSSITYAIKNFEEPNILLGEYATEERTLEILDMIQHQIIKGCSKDDIINGRRIKREFVFQMPEK